MLKEVQAPKPPKPPKPMELRARARANWPNSKHNQRAWLRVTAYLYATGKHRLLQPMPKEGSE
jgi:hypothetical protein